VLFLARAFGISRNLLSHQKFKKRGLRDFAGLADRNTTHQFRAHAAVIGPAVFIGGAERFLLPLSSSRRLIDRVLRAAAGAARSPRIERPLHAQLISPSGMSGLVQWARLIDREDWRRSGVAALRGEAFRCSIMGQGIAGFHWRRR